VDVAIVIAIVAVTCTYIGLANMIELF